MFIGALLLGTFVTADDWKLQKQLYDAIKNNDIKKIEALLTEKPSLANKKIKYHNYPVMDAINMKAIKSLKCLVENGANINKKDKRGNNLLHYVAANFMNKTQIDETLTYLINEKKMKLEAKNKEGKTPFIYSCSNNGKFAPWPPRMSIIIEAFHKYKANLNAQDATGKTMLHYLVCGFKVKEDPNKTDLTRMLAAAKLLANQTGVNVNITDKEKRTPLVTFLAHVKEIDDAKKVDFITCLMENGAKTKIRSKKKEYALKMVEKKSNAYKAMKAKYKKKKK